MGKKWISKIEEQDLGFENVPVCRPRFIFFDFDGLKPNTAYWVFFNQVNVTNYCNTSYSINDYHNSARNSDLREPGEKYKNATGFPTALGGPTGTPLYSDSTGSLKGAFYLQSNDTLSFPTGRLQLTVIDISVFDLTKALSYATAVYTADGQYQLYTEVDNGYWKNTGGGGSTSTFEDRDIGEGGDGGVDVTEGPTIDLPGNWLERTFGFGVGGDYMAGKGKYAGVTDETRKADKAGKGPNSNTGDRCVIATYAQTTNSNLLTAREKKKAELWCIRTYHGTWWGEAIRRGYRYLGRKAISTGNAERHFQEFIDYVAFGRGDKRTVKTFTNFTYRTLQFFVYGLTVARKEK